MTLKNKNIMYKSPKFFLEKLLYVQKAADPVVFEGGNALDGTRPIKQSEVRQIKEELGHILKQIGLEGESIDWFIIGSAGKKLEDHNSGDIDIAVSADKLAQFFSCPFDDILDELYKKIKSMGYDAVLARGFEQVSFGYPLKDGMVAQVDLMISTSLDWSNFIYYSPDFRKAESKYKGVYRNLLLSISISSTSYTPIKLLGSDVEEYTANVLRLNQGIVNVTKSFMGKNGLKKGATLLKQHDKFITRTPQEIVDLLFVGAKPDDIKTFEGLLGLVKSKKFKYPKKADEILTKLEETLENLKLPKPEIL